MKSLPGCWLKRCPNSLSHPFSWFQVQVIEVVLNNTFYNVVDMKNLGLTNDKEVLVPVEAPYGSCACTLGRKKFFEAQGHMLRDERRCQFGLAAAQGN